MTDSPRVSVATATHDPKLLGPLAKSLQEQTFGKFEWVILANGKVTDAEIEERIHPVADKVRIVRAPEGTEPNVGAVKKLAFEACLCDLIVEADHDDILAPKCLQRVWEEYRKTGADFIYSDMAIIEDESEDDIGPASWPSHCQAGLYETEIAGVKRLAHRVPEVSGHFFFTLNIGGPCHVRAWKKEFYTKVGGHRTDFTISDDYELITRMYIEGAKFHHIPECLYIYRVFPGNTSNRDKGREVVRNEFAEYYRPTVVPVLRRWAREAGLKGAETPQELATALSSGAPGSFALIVADDTTPEVADQKQFMDRVHELLVHGGWLVAGSRGWTQEEILRRTRPGASPVSEKFQEVEIWADFDRKDGEPVKLNDFKAMNCLLVKKEGDKVLPGRDYWAMKADPWIERTFRPMFREANATMVRKNGTFEIYGGPLARKLVESVSQDHPGVFVYKGPPRGEILPPESPAKKDRTLEELLDASPMSEYMVLFWDRNNRMVELGMKAWGVETLVAHLMYLAPKRGYDRFMILDGEKSRVLFEFDLGRFDRMLEQALPARVIELARMAGGKAGRR